MSKNIFARLLPNCLVSKNRDSSKEGVDQMLKDTYMYGGCSTSTPCFICNKPATYRVIPKPGVPNSAFIEDKGFICENCLSAGLLDKENYGIRKLK